MSPKDLLRITTTALLVLAAVPLAAYLAVGFLIPVGLLVAALALLSWPPAPTSGCRSPTTVSVWTAGPKEWAWPACGRGRGRPVAGSRSSPGPATPASAPVCPWSARRDHPDPCPHRRGPPPLYREALRATLTAAVVDRIRLAAGPRRQSATSPFPQLSAREVEVLDLMARGWSNPRIADHFVLSLRTVRNHVSNVLTKLGTQNRAEAVARARDAGLGQPGPPGR